MIDTATIIPTGDEIKAGIVFDTDSAAVVQQLVRYNPEMQITRIAPVTDEEDKIEQAIRKAAAVSDLVVLIGGSGGGHRYSSTLGKDFTHTALEAMLSPSASRQLFGKNGHLWSCLVCGRLGDALVLNLPGPFVEASAAIKAFVKNAASDNLETINAAMAEAVRKQYP